MSLYSDSEVIHLDATICTRPYLCFEGIEGEDCLIQEHNRGLLFLCLSQVIHHTVEPSFVLRLVKVDHLLNPLNELEAYVVFLVQSLHRGGGRYLHLWEFPVEELRPLLD